MKKNNWDIHENAQAFIVELGSQSNSEAIPRKIGKLSIELKESINDEKQGCELLDKYDQ